MSDRFHIEHITLDCRDAGTLAAFWSAATGLAIADDSGDFVRLEPGQGGIRLAFQSVPEEKIAKNRMHIDVNTDDMIATVDRLVELGATVVGRHSSEHVTWTVMQDPEGNEFCVN
ncbi:MAG: VOC family protein [Acidimicrobiia bacterium]|nr:VOC family protein [Acidimicrobiia bacterium]